MPDTSFWDAPNRTTPSVNDRIGLQRGQGNAGEHITLGQMKDLTLAEVSNLTEKTAQLTGNEDIFIRDGGQSLRVKASKLITEPNWVTFPVNTAQYSNTPGIGQSLRYKKIGNRVFLQGLVNKVGTTTSTYPNNLLGTLPAGFRPIGGSVILNPLVRNPYTSGTLVEVTTAGEFRLSLTGNIANALVIQFDGLFFFID